jgi:murein hydrolase activator
MGMNKVSNYIYIFSVIAVLTVGAGYDEILNDKNRQKDYLQKQIDECNGKIQRNSSLVLIVEKQIDSTVTKLNTLNEFLKNYQNERYLSPEQISAETNAIAALEEEVERTQKSLQGKIINLYKHGKNYELELLLSAKSPNEYLRRNQYLQKFAQSRKKELQDLKNKRFILEEKKQMVNLSTSSKRFYIESKRIQAKQLEDTLNKLTAYKSQTENESNTNGFRIDRMDNELNNIKNYISNFIAYKPSFRGSKISRINYTSDDLSVLKGRLNPPADLGLIRIEFGDITNNATGTKTTNNGVDFSLAYGSKVYSVANGTVSIIGEIPFYGKVIIISHDNNYKTVYACLSEISVKAGDKVRLNQVIGKSGTDPEGQILHFELWQGKTPFNPREWIRF